MKDRYTRIVEKFGMLGLYIKDKELTGSRRRNAVRK